MGKDQKVAGICVQRPQRGWWGGMDKGRDLGVLMRSNPPDPADGGLEVGDGPWVSGWP